MGIVFVLEFGLVEVLNAFSNKGLLILDTFVLLVVYRNFINDFLSKLYHQSGIFVTVFV